jgi:site-specific recombinase XerD
MEQKLPSIITKAIETIDGFDKVYKLLHQHTTLQGKSQSTFENYIRRITRISLHFNKLPEYISDDEINEYLTALALSSQSPSRSSFKHMVYGLRYYFRHMGLNQRVVKLPSLKKEIKLPVILNRSELIELFKAPTMLKHRVLLALAYSAGLRSQEIANLRLSDIDYERKTIHIVQSKFKKDRIVPLSELMSKGLKRYISVENPVTWLFNGKDAGSKYSTNGLSWVMRIALKKTNISKQVNMHSLRHSYATHLLEDGINIVIIKELLGHVHISTTMIYLHVAQIPYKPPHSPFDKLYIKQDESAKI